MFNNNDKRTVQVITKEQLKKYQDLADEFARIVVTFGMTNHIKVEECIAIQSLAIAACGFAKTNNTPMTESMQSEYVSIRAMKIMRLSLNLPELV